ncbi:PQQ-binding-like beta-propeller repeat protein [Streptomyces lateritius]|uniref:PQQ-binding-like beta-propeller repeat protein n=1 Tax=Streptomyces lateritius TaxID=67313 RepID=A0ABW6YMA4_9ACTN
MLVRSRYDTVTAFDTGTGKRRWEYAPPGQEHVCAVSRSTAGAMVLIARGSMGADAGCSTVVALDLTNGRELWHTPRTPADGGQRWTVLLDGRTTPRPDGQVALLSTEPVVVQLGGTAEGQPGAYLAFGGDGKAVGRIGTTGGYGTLLAHAPALVAIADGRLHVGAEAGRRAAHRDRVVAFDLASGSEVWLRDVAVAGGLRALDVTGGRVTVLADRGSRQDGLDVLRVLGAATGDEKGSLDTGVDVDQEKGDLADLRVYENLVIAVRWGRGCGPSRRTRG